MVQSSALPDAASAPSGRGGSPAPLRAAKKKGCKQKKCSKWRGGPCRCGRE